MRGRDPAAVNTQALTGNTLGVNGAAWGQEVLFHQCWHAAVVFRDRVSQKAESCHVQLCPCNPNTGRNAKSSFPAVVSLLACVLRWQRKPGASAERRGKMSKQAGPEGSASHFCLMSDAAFRLTSLLMARTPSVHGVGPVGDLKRRQ